MKQMQEEPIQGHKPKISICMPIYNASLYLGECIDSILSQTFTDFEVLVVDDGSTDNSLEIMQFYNDPRIKIIKNEHNYISSLNILLEKAVGKYIARMDADDIMIPDRLQIQYDYMETHPDADALGGGLCFYGNENDTFIPPILNDAYQLKDLLTRNILPNPTMMVRNEFLHKHQIRYEHDYIYAEDYRFWARLIHAGARIFCINHIFIKYRNSKTQITNTHREAMWDASIKVKEDITDWLTENEKKSYTPPIVKPSKKKLTVIIPFLNENEEVEKTVSSIRDTVGEEVEIFVINDQSTDGYPYQKKLQPFHVYYFYNDKRKGVAASRDFGISQCLTPYFILLDAHMRFYDNKWAREIVRILVSNGRQLLCCQTKVLKKDEEGIVHEEDNQCATSFGAYLPLSKSAMFLNVEWNREERYPHNSTEPIAVVLGAGYAASTRYWKHLKGLEGLLSYGSDEAYISLKVWLEGGQCTLLKNIIIGHIYRTVAPYPIHSVTTVYNQLIIADTILPPAMRYWTYAIACSMNKWVFFKAYKMIMKAKKDIISLQTYYERIFTKSFNEILPLHRYCTQANTKHLIERNLLLPQILDWIASRKIEDSGIINGKAGIIIWLLHYESYSGKDLTRLWNKLLNEIKESILQQKLPYNFKYGLCGIGWMLIYIARNRFILEDPSPFLSYIDKAIQQLSISAIEDNSLDTGIGGILCYIVERIQYIAEYSSNIHFSETYIKDLQEKASRILQSSEDKAICFYAFQFIDIINNGCNGHWEPKINNWLEFPMQIPQESIFWKIGLRDGVSGYTLASMLLEKHINHHN